MALERVGVEMTSVAAGAITSLRVADALAGVDSESVTKAVMVKLPTWLVVPEMVAVGVPEVGVKPDGRPVIFQV